MLVKINFPLNPLACSCAAGGGGAVALADGDCAGGAADGPVLKWLLILLVVVLGLVLVILVVGYRCATTIAWQARLPESGLSHSTPLLTVSLLGWVRQLMGWAPYVFCANHLRSIKAPSFPISSHHDSQFRTRTIYLKLSCNMLHWCNKKQKLAHKPVLPPLSQLSGHTGQTSENSTWWQAIHDQAQHERPRFLDTCIALLHAPGTWAFDTTTAAFSTTIAAESSKKPPTTLLANLAAAVKSQKCKKFM